MNTLPNCLETKITGVFLWIMSGIAIHCLWSVGKMVITCPKAVRKLENKIILTHHKTNISHFDRTTDCIGDLWRVSVCYVYWLNTYSKRHGHPLVILCFQFNTCCKHETIMSLHLLDLEHYTSSGLTCNIVFQCREKLYFALRKPNADFDGHTVIEILGRHWSHNNLIKILFTNHFIPIIAPIKFLCT